MKIGCERKMVLADWKFGSNIFEKDNYYYKDRRLISLELHGWTKTGSKGKPVAGGYSIEIDSNVKPKVLKHYFPETTNSYPNYITQKDGVTIRHFDRKTDAKKAMILWSKKNKKNIERFVRDYGKR